MITKKDIGTAFGGAALALTTALSSGPALSQEPADAQHVGLEQTNAAQAVAFQTRNVTHHVSLSKDADLDADKWVVDKPYRVAVSVHIGQGTYIPSQEVEATLRADFEKQGLSGMPFFFELGNDGDTTVAFHTDQAIFGPYILGVVRNHVAEDSAQIKYNRQFAAYEPTQQ